MDLKPRFTFGDGKRATIVGVEAMSFMLSRGAKPSVCQVSIPYNPNLLSGPFPMIISDGNTTLRWSNCVVNDVQVTDASGQSMAIAILDRRWKWAYPRVSGQYNVRKAGNAYVKGTKKSVRELAMICLKALGETEQSVDLSKMPDDIFPYVNWDYELAAPALERLCGLANSHICLGHDDRIRIYRDGIGKELPALPSSNKSIGFEVGHRPGYVGIASAPFCWQFDFVLEPVGLDVDGEVKPINELSYAPKLIVNGLPYPEIPDWGTCPHNSMENVVESCRQLALETVWRWYRVRFVKQLARSGTVLMPMTKEKVYTIDQMLPLLQHQVDYVPLHNVALVQFVKGGYDEQSRQKKQPQIWGKFLTQNGNGSTNIPSKERFNENVDLDFYDVKIDSNDGSIVPTEAMKKVQKYIFHGGYEIDYERGIVKFSDAVILRQKFYLLAEEMEFLQQKGFKEPPDRRVSAKLYLRTACNFRSFESRSLYRWGYKKKIEGAPDPSLVDWTVRDDIVPEWKVSQKTLSPQHNIEFVERQQQYYLKHELEKYENRLPGNMTVPALVPISPDGKIAQVVFEIDSEGFIQTSINKEIEGLTNMPDYKERRDMLARLATEDMLQRMNGVQP